MTLDEAIKHCEEVAEESEYSAIMFKQKKEASAFLEKAEAEKAENDCQQCAADHRQLAEWLKELKERRAAVVKRGRWLHFHDDGIIFCSECGREAYWDSDGQQLFDYCPYCGADMSAKG